MYFIKITVKTLKNEDKISILNELKTIKYETEWSYSNLHCMGDGENYEFSVEDNMITMKFKIKKWLNSNITFFEHHLMNKFPSIIICKIKIIVDETPMLPPTINETNLCNQFLDNEVSSSESMDDDDIKTPTIDFQQYMDNYYSRENYMNDIAGHNRYYPDNQITALITVPLNAPELPPLITNNDATVVSNKLENQHYAILISVYRNNVYNKEVETILEGLLKNNDINIKGVINSFLIDDFCHTFDEKIIEIPANPGNLFSWTSVKGLDTDFYELYQQINN